jgi:hypothetical protein
MCVTTFRLLHQLGPRISQSVPHLGSSSALRARSEARKSRWAPKGCRARGLATILSSKLLSLVVASELLRTPGPVRILFEPDQRVKMLCVFGPRRHWGWPLRVSRQTLLTFYWFHRFVTCPWLSAPWTDGASMFQPSGGARVRRSSRLAQVVAQDLGAGGVAQLGHCPGFELPDAFSGDPVDLADLIECARLTVGESESQPDDAGLALG